MTTCYMCDEKKTSTEHVPPRCLFPEKKDSPAGKDYRKSLIKVPSCDKHNSAKSKEDEFFLMYMAASAFTSQAAEVHQNTKLVRILERKPHVWAMLMKQSTPATITDTRGHVQYTCAFHIDEDRFLNQMQHIAYGIYFHHFGKKWLANVSAIPIQGLLVNNPSAQAANEATKKVSIEIFSNIQKHGDNLDVFYYQITEGLSGVLALASFYEHIKVVLLYSQNR